MLKRNFSVVLILCFVITIILSVTTFATSSQVTALVNKTNTDIERLIDTAISQANQYTTLYQNRVAEAKALLDADSSQRTVINQRIAQYKVDYSNQINDLGNNLITNCRNKVLDVYNITSRSEVDLSSVFIPVKLGDKTFLVDPLKFVCK
jgi:predicted PurR-regulated permease PerM